LASSGRTDADVPVIGDHVTIEAGAKIFGGIVLGDWTHVATNAVVNKSFTEPGQIVGGVPAKVIKANPNCPKA
jgi:serine O-acetyltransferase